MNRKNILMLLIILAIFGFTLWAVVPLLASVELIYQPQFSENITAPERAQTIDNALATIRERVAESGVDDAVVARYGDEGISVKLPDHSDEIVAIGLVGFIDSFQVEEAIVHGERFGRKGLHLGLDLVGGVRLVYEVEFADNSTSQEKDAAIGRTLTIIQNRIDKYGVTEPEIRRMGEDRIEVQLPGFTDEEAAKRLVEQTGFLDFRETELKAPSTPVYLSDYLAQDELAFIDAKETGDRIFAISVVNELDERSFRTIAILAQGEDGTVSFTDAVGEPLEKESLADFGTLISWMPARGDNGTLLTGDYLADAQAQQDTSEIVPQYVISITWNTEGSIYFDQIAGRLYASGPEGTPQRNLGIFLDDTLLSSPQILRPSYSGSGQIQGNFSPQGAEELANLLKEGSLPIPLKQPPLFEQKVSATLGSNFIDMGWKAGIIGIALVMLFMIAYYRTAGFLASMALMFYGVLVLAIFKLFPVTLSLAGLGGFIVSLGMAVDANVLIFERFKEELRKGRTMGAAVEEGFNRAWTAILDSNVTTIIACLILIWLASSVIASAQVMGFAVTLLIGVIMSMFTAMVVTRTLLRFFIHTGLGKQQRLFLMDWGKK